MIRVEGKEPHWSASAQDLVAGLIMAVRLTLPPKSPKAPRSQEVGSLAHVREMLGYDYDRFRTNVLGLIEVARNEEAPARTRSEAVALLRDRQRKPRAEQHSINRANTNALVR